MLFQRPDRLHQRALKGVVDCHDLSGGLHLGAQEAGGMNEFVKGPLGDLHHAVVQSRLKAGRSLAGDGVGDLVEGISQSDLGRHLGDGVSRGFRCQGRGPADPGIDLDDRVFEAVGVQGELHVAAPLDLQSGDNVQRRRTKHLVLPVRQGLGGSHHDGVAGMDAHRVHVFHVADGDHVAGPVPDDLVFNLLPAGDASLDQHLPHPAQADAARCDLVELRAGAGDASSGAAQGIGRPDNHRQTDLRGEIHGVLHALHHFGCDAGLADPFHGVLEALPVLCLADGLGGGAQQAHSIALQGSVLRQGHSQIQSRLTPQGGQDGIGTLHLDDLCHGGGVQRLDVDVVGDVPVGHNGGRVGVHQHHLHPFLPEGTAGLGARVVEFRRLADNDGPGADDQHLPDVRILRHALSPPSCFR